MPETSAAIRKLAEQGKSGEDLFFELAIEDLTQAADLLRPIYDRTCGVDGWVSLEVSPLLAHDTETTLTVAKDLHARAGRSNLFIKIPGTKEGLPAIEEAIFAGVPINVTLLFSREQYVAAADAYLRGIQRRIVAGLARFAKAGVDVDALAARLQDEGAASFVKSWNELIEVIASKTAALARVS